VVSIKTAASYGVYECETDLSPRAERQTEGEEKFLPKRQQVTKQFRKLRKNIS
jgi:hypothetical protein